MSITQQRQALAGLVLFTPEITIWGGTVNFDPRNQLSENARQELPPHQLATNGQLQLIPAGAARRPGGKPSPLSPLTSLRKAVHRLLRSRGFAFLGSTAVPQSIADGLLEQMRSLEMEFETAREELLADLPELYDHQQQAFPIWASMLKRHQPEVADLRRRFRFLIHVHGIAVPEGLMASAHCNSTAAEVLPALLAEVARSADEILRESFTGRSEVTQKAVNPVRHLIDKLDAFTFVDPKVSPLVGVLRKQMQDIPKQGVLAPAQVNAVMGTLGLMARPEHLLVHGAQALASGMLFPQPAPPPVVIELPLAQPEMTPEPHVIQRSNSISQPLRFSMNL